MPFSTFDGLGLVEPLRLALKAENHLKPTPIQARAIRLLIQGKDLLGIAETGSGKTAAFALPILQRLSLRPMPRSPGTSQALILAPTRELASQIGERFGAYGRGAALTLNRDLRGRQSASSGEGAESRRRYLDRYARPTARPLRPAPCAPRTGSPSSC